MASRRQTTQVTPEQVRLDGSKRRPPPDRVVLGEQPQQNRRQHGGVDRAQPYQEFMLVRLEAISAVDGREDLAVPGDPRQRLPELAALPGDVGTEAREQLWHRYVRPGLHDQIHPEQVVQPGRGLPCLAVEPIAVVEVGPIFLVHLQLWQAFTLALLQDVVADQLRGAQDRPTRVQALVDGLRVVTFPELHDDQVHIATERVQQPGQHVADPPACSLEERGHLPSEVLVRLRYRWQSIREGRLQRA